MTTTNYANAANAANAANSAKSTTAAAPKWRVMTRRSFAVRGTSRAGLLPGILANMTPYDRAYWRVNIHPNEMVYDQQIKILHNQKRGRLRYLKNGVEYGRNSLIRQIGVSDNAPWPLHEADVPSRRSSARELIEHARRFGIEPRWCFRHRFSQNFLTIRWETENEDDARNYGIKPQWRLEDCLRQLARERWRLARRLLYRRSIALYWQEQTRRRLARERWRLAQRLLHRRSIALYWQEQTQRALFAPGGAGRKADRAAFESEFAS